MSPADAMSQAEQAERLRQQTLAFNQWHRHRERWFTLRFTMGWVAVAMLPVVCFLAAFVILNYEQFGAKAVTVASGALLTAAGLLAAVWKRILSPSLDELPPAEQGEQQGEPEE
jgi:hypothetical protein